MFRLMLIVVVLCASLPAWGTTWTVQADGSGDVPTIQAAMDAAASGDTIQLGPGVFDDHGPDPGWPSHDLYFKVWTDVTILGAGRDATIIGRQDSEHHGPPVDVMQVAHGVHVEIRDLTLQLNDHTSAALMMLGPSSVVVTDCGFRGATSGVHSSGSTRLDIVDCAFEDIRGHAVSLNTDGPATVQGCRFADVDLGVAIWGGEARVADTEFIGDPDDPSSVGANVGEMSSASFRRCTLHDHGRSSIHLEAGTVDLNDCHIGQGSGVGLDIYDALLRGRNNVITGSTAAMLIHRIIETHEFHRNHIITSGGWTVQAGWWYGDGGQFDLAHNWWGTDDPEQIAASILDHADDPEILLEVTFSPFLDEPTATEARSLSDIKAMFR